MAPVFGIQIGDLDLMDVYCTDRITFAMAIDDAIRSQAEALRRNTTTNFHPAQAMSAKITPKTK